MTHWICEPNLTFMVFIILELFTVIVLKCRHYTPEPRLQATNRETWIRVIIKFILINFFAFRKYQWLNRMAKTFNWSLWSNTFRLLGRIIDSLFLRNDTILMLHIIPNRKLQKANFQEKYNLDMCTVDTLTPRITCFWGFCGSTIKHSWANVGSAKLEPKNFRIANDLLSIIRVGRFITYHTSEWGDSIFHVCCSMRKLTWHYSFHACFLFLISNAYN